jgi:hypothetical protein
VSCTSIVFGAGKSVAESISECRLSAGIQQHENSSFKNTKPDASSAEPLVIEMLVMRQINTA